MPPRCSRADLTGAAVPSLDQELSLREAKLLPVAPTQTPVQAFTRFIMLLENWLDEHPEGRRLIDEDPQFLRSAAFGALRPFIASQVRIRRATDGVTLSSGRTVYAGKRIGLLFRDPNSQAEHFGPDADRFDQHSGKPGRAPWGLAFGGGPHSCIGRTLFTGQPGNNRQVDGTMVIMGRRLYAAGLRLNRSKPIVRAASVRQRVSAARSRRDYSNSTARRGPGS
jgi:hypothetical protein